jgi:hypothetical protein
MRWINLISEGYRSSFEIPKVSDVIDSNSCHMRSIRPSHDLGGLVGLFRSRHEGSRGAHEPLDPRV